MTVQRAAALAIEHSREFREAFEPVLSADHHPAAAVFARLALEAAAQFAEQVHAVYAARCDDPGHLRQGRMCAIRVVRLEADGGHKEPFAALLREGEPA